MGKPGVGRAPRGSEGVIDYRHDRYGLPGGEALRATAVHFLSQGNEAAEAAVLASCAVELGGLRRIGGAEYALNVTLRCRRDVWERLQPVGRWGDEPELKKRLRDAIQASLPGDFELGSLDVRAALVASGPNGATPGAAAAGGGGVAPTESPPEAGVSSQSSVVSDGESLSPTHAKVEALGAELGDLRKTVLEIMRRKSEKQAAMGQSEAQRIFAVLTKLRTEPRKWKAPLHTVFELMVLKGKSGKDVAADCECVPSLVSARVKTIEERFDMSIETLRNHASELLEVEASVKGDRRVSKKDGDVMGWTGGAGAEMEEEAGSEEGGESE
jgi:hypothetical protein